MATIPKRRLLRPLLLKPAGFLYAWRLAKKDKSKLRIFLLILGWESLIGSLIESAILLHAVFLIVLGPGEWGMNVEAHIYEHLPIFIWLLKLAYAVFPDNIVSYFLNWPVVLFYPIRITASILIGGWALRAAKRMKEARG